MRHLGERMTALVDGQLDDNTRDAVLSHLAHCLDCRAAVERERAIKSLLHGLPDAAPRPEFVGTLLALAEPGGPLPPERRPFPDAANPPAGWRTSGRYIPGPRTAEHSQLRRRTSVRLAAGGAVGVVALTAALAALGGQDPAGSRPTSVVVPPMQQFTFEHARSSGSLPFFEPASAVVPDNRSSDFGP